MTSIQYVMFITGLCVMTAGILVGILLKLICEGKKYEGILCDKCGKPIKQEQARILISAIYLGDVDKSIGYNYHTLCATDERSHVIVNKPDGSSFKSKVLEQTENYISTSFGTFHRSTGRYILDELVYITDTFEQVGHYVGK